MKMKDRIAELERQLRQEQRYSGAMAEWFMCEGRGVEPEGFQVTGSPSALCVVVRGMTRAAGGVCVLHVDGYRNLPRYLDDLLAEWHRDPSYEIRETARAISRRRDELNRPQAIATGT